jgi:hypothetical protein
MDNKKGSSLWLPIDFAALRRPVRQFAGPINRVPIR